MNENLLIGPAAKVDSTLQLFASEIMQETTENAQVLLFGAPGVGKTEVANRLARTLTGGSPFAIESINGKELDLAQVKGWRHAMRYGNIFADWDVKVVNEVDKASADAQVLMLTLLDELPPRRAVIVTSNLDIRCLHERFQTRFMQFKVEAPATDEIVTMLRERFPGLRDKDYGAIAVGSGGNVRAALKDARATHLAFRAGKVRSAESQPEEGEVKFW